MQNPQLTIPKQLCFDKHSQIRLLKLQNCSPYTIVFKIKSNHKTALSISCSHDFIPALSTKEVPVKLLENVNSIKLQVNYTKPTQQMIQSNDSKMNGIDRSQIWKHVIKIIISEQFCEQKSGFLNEIREQKNQNASIISEGTDKGLNSQNKQSQIYEGINQIKTQELQIVEQHEQQDLQQIEEEKKKIMKKIEKIQEKINIKKQAIIIEQTQKNRAISQNSFLQPWALLSLLIVTYLFGSLIKIMIY